MAEVRSVTYSAAEVRECHVQRSGGEGVSRTAWRRGEGVSRTAQQR